MTRCRVLYTTPYGERRGCPVDNEEIGNYMIDNFKARGYTNVIFDRFDPEELEKQDAIKKAEEVKAQAEMKEKETAINIIIFTILMIGLIIVLACHVSFIYIALALIGIALLAFILPVIAAIFSSGVAVGVVVFILYVVIRALTM